MTFVGQIYYRLSNDRESHKSHAQNALGVISEMEMEIPQDHTPLEVVSWQQM